MSIKMGIRMKLISEMEAYAQVHSVPIMEKEGIIFLCDWIQKNHIGRILEIGTAIGYSAIRMALCNEQVRVVSVERDDQRYAMAVENVQKAALQDRITLVHEDALEYEAEGMFDLLFIDAAKAQYLKFYGRFEKHLPIGSYIISDNLNFHGFVEHPEIIRSRHLKQMVRKITAYRNFLETDEKLSTEFFDVGDGIAISRKKAEK